MNAAARSAAITRERTVAEMVAIILDAGERLSPSDKPSPYEVAMCKLYGHARKLAPPVASEGGCEL